MTGYDCAQYETRDKERKLSFVQTSRASWIGIDDLYLKSSLITSQKSLLERLRQIFGLIRRK